MSARSARLSDVEAVLALVHANSLAQDGTTESTVQSVLEEWNDPGIDLASDTCVLMAGDQRLVGYVAVWGRGREALPYVDLCVPHTEPDLEAVVTPWLLGWAERRAWDSATVVPRDLRLAARVSCDSRETRYLRLLADCGYVPIRYTFRMGIALTNVPDPGHCPEGLALRAAEPDDLLAVFEASRDGWRDHFGYVERPYEAALEMWRHRWATEFTPGHWWLGMDGETVAGFCLNRAEYAGDPSQGYVTLLCVRRDYRRRGLAEALLRHSLVELYAAGKSRVCLHVDGQSLTGATRLYERVGMRVETSYALCEKELRPGLDPSTREAAPAVDRLAPVQ
jgi:ribosomal protein S18 acetylase RimI-like enzyme